MGQAQCVYFDSTITHSVAKEEGGDGSFSFSLLSLFFTPWLHLTFDVWKVVF